MNLPPRFITSRIDPRNVCANLSIHGIEELNYPHDHLSSLTNHELFALQSRQMLGDSWPRGTDHVGDVFLTEVDAKEGPTRLLDSKVRAQFEQRNRYSFVKIEVQKTRAAHQEAIPLFQVILMKLFENGLGRICGNAVENRPIHGADAAIVVSLALKADRLSGSAGYSGIGPGASIATVTRSLRELRQVMRAVPDSKM
jgi:hypothetical protein